MSRPHIARFLGSALVVLSLGPVLQGPPCFDPAVCPMDQTAAAGACDGMDSDCCATAGERAPQAFTPAAPIPSDEPVAILGAIDDARSWPRREAEAAFPGGDVQALLSVFLI